MGHKVKFRADESLECYKAISWPRSTTSLKE